MQYACTSLILKNNDFSEYNPPELQSILKNHRQKKFKNTFDDWSENRLQNRGTQPISGSDKSKNQNLSEFFKKAKEKILKNALENWTGKWFPQMDPKPTPLTIDTDSLHHSAAMGGGNPACDDGKVIYFNNF